MKKILSIVAAIVVLAAMVGIGVAQEPLPEHPHMLILGLELDANEEPVGFRKCVDLAGGEELPLGSQHEHVHFGTAGEKLFTNAGHAVIPAAPFPGVPFADCADLEAIFE